MEEELEIKQTAKFVTLEQAITEGSDALIPYEFNYPNSDLTVEVKLKPITNPELNEAMQQRKLLNSSLDVELLKIALFNPDETPIDEYIISKLPAGVVAELTQKLADISGLKSDKEAQDAMVKELVGF